MKKRSALAVPAAVAASASTESAMTSFGMVDVNAGGNKNGAAGRSRRR
jgi:hypothetical protein